MNNQPIILIGGEPNSVFLEIFFKSIKKINCKSPLIIIASKNLLVQQMKKLGFSFKINLIDESNINLDKLNNKKINLVNVNYNFKKPFEKITIKSNEYIQNSFETALKILKKKKINKIYKWTYLKKAFSKKKIFGYY